MKNFNPTSTQLFSSHLLAGSVLGDSLGTLSHNVLGQFSRQDETNRGLDLARRQGGSLVVGSKLGGLSGHTLKDVIDKAVHDVHGLVADSNLWVNLLQDLVDVAAVGLGSALLALADGSFGSLGWGFSGWGFGGFWWHDLIGSGGGSGGGGGGEVR